MSGSATLAIQVVNFRTRSYLERCLRTVVPDAERSGLEFEVMLLDNASGDNLEEFGRRYPNCRNFTAQENKGFGAGHNWLADRTDATHVLILNPDVEFLSPGSAMRLARRGHRLR